MLEQILPLWSEDSEINCHKDVGFLQRPEKKRSRLWVSLLFIRQLLQGKRIRESVFFWFLCRPNGKPR